MWARHPNMGFTLVEAPVSVPTTPLPAFSPEPIVDLPESYPGPDLPVVAPELKPFWQSPDGSVKSWVWVTLGTLGVGAAYWLWKG
jgi:hypothetical protein